MNPVKVAVVTGASSGIGRLAAARLRRSGYRVFGTSRKDSSAIPDGVERLTLDVRSDESVRAFVLKLESLCDRVDLLVNNAGRTQISLAEETSLEVARDIFETNFWGVVRMTNAVLPMMRRQRHGRIINIGSLAGRVPAPGQAFYSATKFALEGYTEALSLELEQFGVDVLLVEPGFFRTSIHESASTADKPLPEYALLRGRIEASIVRAVIGGADPEAVAETIARLAEAKAPPLRTRVGADARWVPRLRAILPERLYRFGVRRKFNLP